MRNPTAKAFQKYQCAMPNLVPLQHQSAMRLFHAIHAWKEAAQHEMDALVPVDQAAALVLRVFSPSWETRGSAVWSTSILADKTNHYYILEDTDPAGKQGSSVPGANPACCVRCHYQTRLPNGHLQL